MPPKKNTSLSDDNRAFGSLILLAMMKRKITKGSRPLISENRADLGLLRTSTDYYGLLRSTTDYYGAATMFRSLAKFCACSKIVTESHGPLRKATDYYGPTTECCGLVRRATERFRGSSVALSVNVWPGHYGNYWYNKLYTDFIL